MIVKVQRQLAPAPDSDAFIYDKQRTISIVTDITPEMRGLFGDDVKFYATATIHGGVLHILDKVPTQNW